MSERIELPGEVKTFVVQALACWDTPSEVVKAVKDEFGLVVSRQAVQAYDPTKVAGVGLSAEFRALFDTTRDAFLKDTASVGIAHRSVRMRTLQRLVAKAESMGNIGLTADLLQQAAKEMGDSFTNRVAMNHSGKVEVDARPDFSSLSKEKRDVLKLLLEEAAENAATGEGVEG